MEKGPVPSLLDSLATLAPMETFDPAAFDAKGDKGLQSVCDLVLALALVYNDYKNSALGYVLLEREGSKVPGGDTAARYEIEGLELHVVRFHAGLLHELMNLIDAERVATQHPLFVEIVRCLTTEARAAWRSLESSATGKPATDSTEKRLLLIRNKVSFHYDAERISHGYQRFFGDPAVSAKAAVSRGKSLQSTRFYFADFAARGYFLSLLPDEESIGEFFREQLSYLEKLNFAVYEIVQRFVEKRGFAWRSGAPR